MDRTMRVVLVAGAIVLVVVLLVLHAQNQRAYNSCVAAHAAPHFGSESGPTIEVCRKAWP